jgi:hypothetical protein
MGAAWMRVEAISEMTIQEFAERNGLTLVVRERRVAADSPVRYHAAFEGAEVMNRGMLEGAYGDGASPDRAIDDYAAHISLKRLAVGAFTDKRREIDVPRLLPLQSSGGVS